MQRVKDQAIILRELDWSETSQVVSLLTREHGKISGVAKGSRRTSPSSVARFSGGIGLLTLGQIVANVKPSSSLAGLVEWDLQKSYWHLHHNLQAQQIGFYAVDLVHALLAEHDAHPGTFDALARLFDELAEPAQQSRALLRFQWDLLLDCGFKPELTHDVQHGDELPEQETYLFDPRGGGVTADLSIMETDSGPWRVRSQTVSLLKKLARGEALGEEDAQAAVRANRLLCVYVRSILDRHLPTMDLIMRG